MSIEKFAFEKLFSLNWISLANQMWYGTASDDGSIVYRPVKYYVIKKAVIFWLSLPKSLLLLSPDRVHMTVLADQILNYASYRLYIDAELEAYLSAVEFEGVLDGDIPLLQDTIDKAVADYVYPTAFVGLFSDL